MGSGPLRSSKGCECPNSTWLRRLKVRQSRDGTRGREYFPEQDLDYVHNLKVVLDMLKYKKKYKNTIDAGYQSNSGSNLFLLTLTEPVIS